MVALYDRDSEGVGVMDEDAEGSDPSLGETVMDDVGERDGVFEREAVIDLVCVRVLDGELLELDDADQLADAVDVDVPVAVEVGVRPADVEPLGEPLSDGVTLQLSDGVMDKLSDGVTDKLSDGVTDKLSDGVMLKLSDGVTDMLSDGVMLDVSEMDGVLLVSPVKAPGTPFW